jgi:hypothetical protein
MEKLPYHPIANPDEIRVLDLLQGTGTDIRCTIRHVRLSDKPNFEAVSYFWGQTNEHRVIICDNYQIRVTPNLYSFLLYVAL